MRRCCLGVVVALFKSVAVGGQETPPPAPLTWSVGIARGLGSTFNGSQTWGQEGAGALLVQWKRGVSRLGFRAEVSRALDDGLWFGGDGSQCGGGCPFSRIQTTSHAAMLSGVLEFRQGRLLRPYAIAGFGLADSRTVSTTNGECTLTGCTIVPTREAWRSRGLSTLLAAGVGVAVNYKRVAAFTEFRPTLNPAALNASHGGLSFGVRIQPDN